MSQVGSGSTASVEYVHKKSNGEIISKGRTTIDRHGRVHCIQKFTNGQIVESIFSPEGSLIEIKKRFPFWIKILRLVGIKKK